MHTAQKSRVLAYCADFPFISTYLLAEFGVPTEQAQFATKGKAFITICRYLRPKQRTSRVTTVDSSTNVSQEVYFGGAISNSHFFLLSLSSRRGCDDGTFQNKGKVNKSSYSWCISNNGNPLQREKKHPIHVRLGVYR